MRERVNELTPCALSGRDRAPCLPWTGRERLLIDSEVFSLAWCTRRSRLDMRLPLTALWSVRLQ